MASNAALDIRFKSDVQQIERVVAQVVHRCREHRFDGRQLSLNVPVALTEALSNAILRGNGDDAGKEVLVVEVVDEGEGFDLEACTTDPTSPENLAREDGRGLFLMRSLMDRVEAFRGDGNVVRLTLHRR